MRSLFPLVFAVTLVAILPPGTAWAADEPRIDEPTRRATVQALKWLASKQNDDGSWSDGRYANNTAITSFALLAFMSQGHLPNQGEFGSNVVKGARFLITSAREEDGYLGGSRGNMYAHAMATLTLLELWGMSSDEQLKPVLEKAVRLIVGSQNRYGGWRYSPQAIDHPHGADISVTIMQVMALRAAKNSGLNVPPQTMENALTYINSCYDRRTGGYAYQPGGGPGFARTAAGLCVLQLTGKYDAQEIERGIKYLKDNARERHHFFYGHYYAAHAMYQVGRDEKYRDEWKNWYENIRRELLKDQGGDGSWSKGREFDSGSPGPVYQTSIAVIILSVPMHYLPIFQR
jgi:hypothetical protein